MSKHRLRWALLCVATIPVMLAAKPASASKKVTIGRGDSVDSLARRFHVSVKDIERANGITSETLLRDGRVLTIPDPPKKVVHASSMRREARIRGDRIAFRLGPNENYRRVTMLDQGSEVVVTGRAGDWFQAELPNGRSAWVRADFLALGGEIHAASAQRDSRVARRDSKDQPKAARKRKSVARRNDDEVSPRRGGRTAARRSRHDDGSQRNHKARRERIARTHSRRSRRPEASAPAARNDVIRTAYSYRGVPYHYGGSTRRGFDCSGFTSYIYRKKGVSLPHSAAGQYGRGRKVSGGHLKQGDLVFFHTTRRGISHVGIYVGEGKFVHASSGGGRVRVDSLNSGYYKSRFRGARRVN